MVWVNAVHGILAAMPSWFCMTLYKVGCPNNSSKCRRRLAAVLYYDCLQQRCYRLFGTLCAVFLYVKTYRKQSVILDVLVQSEAYVSRYLPVC